VLPQKGVGVPIARSVEGTPCGNGPCQPGSLPGGVPYAPPDDDSRWGMSTGTAGVPYPRVKRRLGGSPVRRDGGALRHHGGRVGHV